MGKMVDMEMDDEDQLDYPTPVAMDKRPNYPCGLCITLRGAELKKLGLEADTEKVGMYLEFKASAKVMHVSAHATDGGDSQECVTLQIEEMSVEEEE